MKALLATAYQRGDIRSNPAAGYRTRYELDATDEAAPAHIDVKALSAEELV